MTRPTLEPARPVHEISAEQVTAYLRENPDFFERHPQVLEDLSLPHSAGRAVSLVERQVSILRDRNIDMRARLSNLVDNARVNDDLFEQTRALLLDALDAPDLDSLLGAVRRHLVEKFGLECVSIVLFGSGTTNVADARFDELDSAQAAIGNLLRNQQTVLGILRPTETAYLFPDRSPAPASAAVVPLTRTTLLGVIAIGSSDAGRFTGEMGTLFIRHVGEVLARLIERLPQS